MTRSIDKLKHKTLIGAIDLTVVIGGAGFAGGMQYQKSHTKKVAVKPATQTSLRDTLSRRINGGMGTVETVDNKSITVDPSRQARSADTPKTYAITDKTKVTKDGKPASVADIKKGDTVTVRTIQADSGDAALITIGIPGSFGQRPSAN